MLCLLLSPLASADPPKVKRPMDTIKCDAVDGHGQALDGIQEDQAKTMQTRTWVCMYGPDGKIRGTAKTVSCGKGEWATRNGGFDMPGDGSMSASLACESGH